MVDNAETQMLRWAKRRQGTLQGALDVLAKGYFYSDATEWRAVCAGWWSRSVEDFAAEVGEFGSHWAKTYWNLIGAVDGDHIDQR